ncbi:tRNA (adenosine(37)-N6)-threonylcarbamoyltransferase complex dimerization subunit type 1 TsaB [Texcoconibacillus texcoconensis]|uniref:tRNA threonylcarbamoyladenosine biosynthesis protein TsaB n=1 Tax=Texcoconibacillus texcoconensis TaxID=1095777 RepID=A0A840QMP3_9BACI|nr:tRNA (adenosine(37)-N6)-threonylcarbamoyltransferase complex dimerization subunit type 1 TsaB [Texcoconibacillus texcoconensis]MBB5172628.1 tRNA threonylcarbamoyladenosine biosynthesis protein TsaB [Texcoconibacillus texcoconensis]
MNVLAIDTSTYVLGVSVIKEGQPVGEKMTNIKKNHALRLMPAVEQLLRDVDIKPADLDRIVVSHGPGSYTGVRIAVTTAKTLAWSLNIPVVGVSSLEALAQNGRYFQGLIAPFIDARRGQVFTGLYQGGTGSVENVIEDGLTDHRAWLEKLKSYQKPVLFLGNEWDKHVEVIEEIMGEQAVLAKPADRLLKPAQLAELGIEKTPLENVHALTPQYLRLAEAEAKWMEQNGREEEKR